MYVCMYQLDMFSGGLLLVILIEKEGQILVEGCLLELEVETESTLGIPSKVVLVLLLLLLLSFTSLIIITIRK